MEDLRVRPGVVIPASDLEERFETSGGPGGQHANRNETRVDLSVDLRTCGGVTDEQRDRMLGNAPADVVRVSISETRSQWRNRAIARARLGALLDDYLAPPPKVRRPTRPKRSAVEERIQEKKRRGQIKEWRKRPEDQA